MCCSLFCFAYRYPILPVPSWSTHEIELLISEIEEKQYMCFFHHDIENFFLIGKKFPAQLSLARNLCNDTFLMILIFFWLKFDMSTCKKAFCIFKQLREISINNFQQFLSDFIRNHTKTLLFLFKNTKLSIYPDIQLLSPLQPQLPERTYLV